MSQPSDDTGPYRPVDDAARRSARQIIDTARIGALAVLHPDDGLPHVARILVAPDPDGHVLTLISTLALHTRALSQRPACALLLGEPPAKGDPLAFPRLTLRGRAQFIEKTPALLQGFLARHPKARLYADFADFRLCRIRAGSAELNAGFGRAHHLSPADLIPAPDA